MIDLENKLKSVSSAHYQPGARCLPNTRVDLLKDVGTWLGKNGPGEESTAWVYGYAGSGKSAMLNSIAKNLEDTRIPFTVFTCKRDDAQRSDVQRILPTICYDLTQFYDDYRGVISNIVSQPKGRSISTGDVASQSELLFGESPSYKVISPAGGRRPRVHVILIDALDECKDSHQRCALAEFLRVLAQMVPWIKVIITSRHESDIAKVLTDNSVHRIDINAAGWNTSADIRLFIEERSEKLKLSLSRNQVDRFQAKASGLFIWCSTVFRYIEDSKKDKTDLVEDILKGQSPSSKENPHAPLYLLYQHVLNNAVSGVSDRKMMETVLSVVAATRRPLSASAITDILYPVEERKGKKVWVENIIKSLFSILYVEERTNAVRACHLSVLEFISGMMSGGVPTLTTSVTPCFAHGVKETHTRIFDGCFAIMERDLRFNICGLEDSFLLNKDVPDLPDRISANVAEALQYAASFWASHLEQANVDAKMSAKKVLAILSTVKGLYWVEVVSLMDVVDRGIVVLQDCASFFMVRPSACDVMQQLTFSRMNRMSWR